ncbi:hypothetical protein [Mycobacterium dioxanotrophicus]|jgi:hypothetical protein|uniref:hypothetical protein n=1 Tax=Mycobacterium dioxanotrophicus TaxID=482462 RepID=UPI0012FAF92E|nr:hypothetical protein [Mycobacterium dioxanotrophicus]
MTTHDIDTVLVEPEHINVMIWAGLWIKAAQYNEPLQWPVLDEHGEPLYLNMLEQHTADSVGQMLLDTNAAAVNSEHGRNNAYVYSYAEPQYCNWQVIEILRAIDFYTFQCAQLENWIYTEAYFLCSVLASRLVQQIPGYLTAAPHITATTQPAMAQQWRDQSR